MRGECLPSPGICLYNGSETGGAHCPEAQKHNRFEVIDGVVYDMTPPPSTAHQRASNPVSSLSQTMRNFSGSSDSSEPCSQGSPFDSADDVLHRCEQVKHPLRSAYSASDKKGVPRCAFRCTMRPRTGGRPVPRDVGRFIHRPLPAPGLLRKAGWGRGRSNVGYVVRHGEGPGNSGVQFTTRSQCWLPADAGGT